MNFDTKRCEIDLTQEQGFHSTKVQQEKILPPKNSIALMCLLHADSKYLSDKALILEDENQIMKAGSHLNIFLIVYP